MRWHLGAAPSVFRGCGFRFNTIDTTTTTTVFARAQHRCAPCPHDQPVKTVFPVHHPVNSPFYPLNLPTPPPLLITWPPSPQWLTLRPLSLSTKALVSAASTNTKSSTPTPKKPSTN